MPQQYSFPQDFKDFLAGQRNKSDNNSVMPPAPASAAAAEQAPTSEKPFPPLMKALQDAFLQLTDTQFEYVVSSERKRRYTKDVGNNNHQHMKRSAAPPAVPSSSNLDEVDDSENNNMASKTKKQRKAPTRKASSSSATNATDSSRSLVQQPPKQMEQILDCQNPKCVPLKPPIPSKFEGNVEEAKRKPVPVFNCLSNFMGDEVPLSKVSSSSSSVPALSPGMGLRRCVMCGYACPCPANVLKSSKKAAAAAVLPSRSSSAKGDDDDKNNSNNDNVAVTSSGAIIPTQNKGICTSCDVKVWVIVTTGLEIKWCKGCKNFRPWAAFGDKGHGTKCVACRDRAREQYAQKVAASQKKKQQLGF